MERKTILALAIIGILVAVAGVAGVIPTPAFLKPMTVVSSDRMILEWQGTENPTTGELTATHWITTVSVDQNDILEYQGGSEKQTYPDGSYAYTKSSIYVKCAPKTPYFESYPLNEVQIPLYADVYDSWTLNPAYYFAYWEIPSWKSVHAPYQIEAKKDSVYIQSPTIKTAGFASWDNQNFVMGSGKDIVEVRNVGILSQGYAQPPTYAVMYDPQGNPHIYDRQDIRDAMFAWNEITVHSDPNAAIPNYMNSYQKLWDVVLSKIPEVTTGNPKEAIHGLHEGVPTYYIQPSANVGAPYVDKTNIYDNGALGKTIRLVTTGVTAFYNLPQGSLSALIQLRVSTEIADTFIWHPPNGVPDITSVTVSPTRIIRGETATVTVRVTNIGTSEDTIRVRVSGNDVAVSTAPYTQQVPKGESRTWQFVLTTSKNYVSDVTSNLVITAEALGSGRSDTEYAYLPQDKTPVDVGSIEVTTDPYDVSVYLDGVYQGKTQKEWLKSTGKLTLESVLPGTHTVKLMYGAEEWSTTVYVTAGLPPSYVSHTFPPVTPTPTSTPTPNGAVYEGTYTNYTGYLPLILAIIFGFLAVPYYRRK